jgi:CxxC motif-containing protein
VGPTERYTCLGCPLGCALELVHEGAEILEVSGQRCRRGEKYARQEFTDPRRGVTTTVAIAGARWARLPVKVTAPVPRDRVREAVRLIHALRVRAPVARGQVLAADFLGQPGLAVVATRSMDRVADPGPPAG